MRNPSYKYLELNNSTLPQWKFRGSENPVKIIIKRAIKYVLKHVEQVCENRTGKFSPLTPTQSGNLMEIYGGCVGNLVGNLRGNLVGFFKTNQTKSKTSNQVSTQVSNQVFTSKVARKSHWLPSACWSGLRSIKLSKLVPMCRNAL